MAKHQLPQSRNKLRKRIAIICEGKEDYEYIKRLISLGVWNSELYIQAFNAEGGNKLFERFRNIPKYDYDLFFFFCDSENPPHEALKGLIKSINAYYHSQNAANDIIFFSNPQTIRIVAFHYKEKFSISSTIKSKNEPFYENVFGIKNYRASQKQIEQIMNGINKDNYEIAKERLKNHDTDDYDKANGTNILRLFALLESSDTSWVDKLSNKLKEKL